MMNLIVSHPIAVAAIALGVLFAALVARALFAGYPPKLLGDSIMNQHQQALVAACADAFFPPGGPIPVSGTEAGLVAYTDGYLRRLNARGRFLLRLLFVFFELSPFVFGPRLRRFSQLALADRLTLLSQMAKSDIYFRRVAFLSMRTVLTMGYLSNARVAASMCMVMDPAPFEAKPLGSARGAAMVAA